MTGALRPLRWGFLRAEARRGRKRRREIFMCMFLYVVLWKKRGEAFIKGPVSTNIAKRISPTHMLWLGNRELDQESLSLARELVFIAKLKPVLLIPMLTSASNEFWISMKCRVMKLTQLWADHGITDLVIWQKMNKILGRIAAQIIDHPFWDWFGTAWMRDLFIFTVAILLKRSCLEKVCQNLIQ